MTVADHPTRVAACHRGELAARTVSTAIELACLVRDADRYAIGEFIDGLNDEQRTALLVVLAGMMPVDVPAATLLSWVTWDEYGRPLPGPVLEAPAPAPRRQAKLKPCGTYAAFRRHEDRGELIDDDCREAATAYWDARREREKGKRAARHRERKAQRDGGGQGATGKQARNVA